MAVLPETDLELARSAACGDAGAFHALVDRHAPQLLRLATWLVGNRHDAEDAVQETLVAAYRGVRGFDGRASFKTWVTRILIRQAGRVRTKSRRHRALETLSEGPIDAAGLEVRSEVQQIEQRMDLMAMIQKLPEDQRQVITLREVHGMAYEEIAEALGVPRGTVESRLHRARAALKQKLSEYAPPASRS